MAKTAFSKLKLTINEDKIPVQIGENTIAVKQYLPVNEKLALIARVIEQAHDQDYSYANPVKIDVFTTMEIIFAYTDIAFTDKQKEDIAKLYDQFVSSGVSKIILDAIPTYEQSIILDGVLKTIDSV